MTKERMVVYWSIKGHQRDNFKGLYDLFFTIITLNLEDKTAYGNDQ